MKQRFFIMVGLMLVLSLAGCSSDSGQAEGDPSETSICEASEETTASVETTKRATETTTVTTTEATTEAEAESPWKKMFFLDEFDRQTDDFYIFAAFSGYFSNSATTKSSLTAAFYIERYIYNNEISDAVGISLFEYDHSKEKNYYSKGKNYNIQILEETDNVIEEKGWMGSESDTIYVWGDEDQNTIINAIRNNQKLTIRIDEEDGMSTYLFDVDCTGFKELFDSTDWNV